ncbi:MAG: glycosyltransferase [Chloroflexota bacterium]
MTSVKKTFPGRMALQQRVLPVYRAAFFDALAGACEGGLSIFAGLPLPQEGISLVEGLQIARFVLARNRHFSDPSSSLYFCWQSGLLAWLRDWNPDALIVEANHRYLSTRRAVKWMHARERPVIGWGLGAPSGKGVWGVLLKASRWGFLLLLDAVIAYSARGAEEYRALGVPDERVYVAPNAVAPRPVVAPPERPSTFIGPPTVLFVGRLQVRKRVDNLLRACAALPMNLQPRMVVVGDGPALEELQRLAKDIYPQTEFAGVKHGLELEAYFTAADVFVLPGTGGLAVQQAMAYGLPTIVARGDGTQEDLVRPDSGWLVPPDDVETLTITLREALSDPTRLRRMGAASYCFVCEEVNIEKMVEVFVEVIEAVTRVR